MADLFNQCGASFSDDRKYRYALWRIWDNSKPLVMFIGLNPSTANETDNDPTIKSVCRIAKNNGFGGVYMMNCFPLVSTNPSALDEIVYTPLHDYAVSKNNAWLNKAGKLCKEIVFAWGSFGVVIMSGRNADLMEMFPQAKALSINKNGSPKHPLYCKSNTQLITYNPKTFKI